MKNSPGAKVVTGDDVSSMEIGERLSDLPLRDLQNIEQELEDFRKCVLIEIKCRESDSLNDLPERC